MDCPHCHVSNPMTADHCSRCSFPLDLDGATIAATLGVLKRSTTESVENWLRDTWAQEADSDSSRATALEPGDVLASRYEIVERLGEGGMGVVYSARDRELDRLVAVKVIRPELAQQPSTLELFKRELILTRQITHRNVIRIFDLGQSGGLKFITMEHIDGHDLKAHVAEKGRLSFAESADVVRQVCLALGAAHEQSIVHRDLKPRNIMVDNRGKVTVMDFGLARTIAVEGITQTGGFVGTPHYMSPEQVEGTHVDGRSDIFALGIVYYELLTGEDPYKKNKSESSLFVRTREKSLRPIEVDPSVPTALSDLVSKCLEIDPRKRYQTAHEILTDLERWRGRARPAGSSRRRFVHVTLSRSIGLAVAAILLCCAGAVAVRKRLLSTHSPGSSVSFPSVSLAVIPFQNSTGDHSIDWIGPSLTEIFVRRCW